MSITQYPLLSQLIRTLKLPIPIPPRLERTQAPWSEHPLQGESIILGAATGSLWTDTVLPMLQATGAQVQRSPEETDSLPVGLRCARHLCASSRHDQGAHLTRPYILDSVS